MITRELNQAHIYCIHLVRTRTTPLFRNLTRTWTRPQLKILTRTQTEQDPCLTGTQNKQELLIYGPFPSLTNISGKWNYVMLLFSICCITLSSCVALLFLLLGPADSVKCFSCGGVLRNWSLSDEPWIEHAKWYPSCTFLLEKKGHAFIEDIIRQREISERKVILHWFYSKVLLCSLFFSYSSSSSSSWLSAS